MRKFVVKAPAECRVDAAAGLKTELLAALDQAEGKAPVTLDISGVERADSSLAQLVLAFMKEAEARGAEAVLVGDTGFRSVPSLLGCDQGVFAGAKAPAATGKRAGKEAAK